MGLLEVGQLVTSRMGRDSGKKYVVIRFYDQSHVEVADGFIRKIERPKRKNIKHLVVHQAGLKPETFGDKEIRAFIELHSRVEKPGKEGGIDGQG